MARKLDPTKIISSSDTTTNKKKRKLDASKVVTSSKESRRDTTSRYSEFADKYQNWYDTADKFVSRKDSEEADPKKLSASKEFGEKKDYSSERWAWDADSFALSSERSTNGFKSEAQKLLEELENDKDYFSEEGYNAYKEFLTSVTNSDYTDVNEALRSEAIFRKNIGNKDVYNEYVTNAKKLSRLGINENTTRSDLKKMLIDDDNAPVTQKLSNNDRTYIEKLTNSRDFIQTMTPDEIRDEIETRKTIGTYKSPEAKTTADVSPYAFFDNYDNPVTWEEFLELSETEKLIDSILEAEYDPNSEGFSRYMRNDRKAIIEKIKNNPDAVTQFSGMMKDEAEKISTYYQYLDAKEQAYGRRKADSEWASKNFVNAALATAYGIVAAPSQIFDYAGNILSGETSELGRRKNVYDDKNIGKIQAYNEGVTSLIDESIDNDVLSWLATTAYSGVTSMSQSMVTGVVASALFGPEVGSAIALSILGSQAASSSYNQAIKNGSTYGEAVGFSVAAGFAEAVMEKMPLDNILKNAKNLTKGSFKEILVTALKNTAYQGLIEGGEELGTSIIDNVADMLINGDKSQFNANIERYVAVEGLSYDEAYKQAAKDQIMEAVESIVGGFIGGAASGGSVEIGKGVANSIRETNERTAAGREILSHHGSAEALSQEIMNNLGLDRATYDKLFKRAEKLSEAKRNKKGDYSGKTARLAERVNREAFAAKEESGSVGRTELIQKKLVSKGISNDEASTIAKDIASDLSKGETIEAIKDKYTDNETVVNTITELTDPESESYDSSLSDFVTEEKKAMAALAYGRAHFDTEYSDESGRIDEAKTELGEITDFIEIKNEDGETDTVPVIRVGDRSVPASEIYLNGDSIYNNVNGMNVDAANAMISAYKSHSGEHIKAADFAKEWKIAYEMGLANRKADSPDFVNFSFSISKEAAEEARSLGAAESRSEREATKSDIKKAQKKKSGREGKISTTEVKNRDYITDSVMVVAKTLSLAGYNIELFEDVSESADRGSYSWNTNTIRLNVAVGTGRGAVNLLLGRTLSHEITHSIQRWSPDAYEELKAFVIEKMGDSLEERVKERMENLGLNRADAIDEIVAYSCEMMLRDSKALTEFAKQHRTLLEKICDIVEEFINKIRNAIYSLYGKEGAESPEAKFMQLYADELQAVFDKALSDALNASEATVDHKTQTAENKKTAENGGKVQYCMRDNSPNEINPKGLTLREQLKEALSTSVAKDWRYIYVGEFTQDFIDKLRDKVLINNYPIVMNYRDAYLSMESKENGKYQSKGINYHNLGDEGLANALESFNNPVYIIKSSKHGKIEMILEGKDYKKRTLFSIVELNTKTQNNQKFIDVHVVTSVYGKSSLANYLNKAELADKIIYKKTEEPTQGIPQVQYERDINVDSSIDSIPDSSEKSKGKVQKSVAEGDSISEAERKQLQLEIINENNPAPNTYNTWVRSVDDILTFEEALNDSDYEGYDDFTPDYDRGMAEEAIRTGKATVYSSYPIEPGVFVSMSRMEAASYSGNGKVYSKQISINDVAWLDVMQGQYAKVDADNAGKIQKSAAYSTEFDRTQKKDSEGRRLSPLQMEYFAKSVIRDKRGRLIPVYHGTKNAGFTIFSKSDDIGYFFARTRRTAETYSGTKKVYAPDRSSPDYEGAGNYKVYLNIKNPLVIEGKGAYWNTLETIGEKVTLDINIKSTSGDGACNVTIKMNRDGKAQKLNFKTTDEVYDFFTNTFDSNIAKAMGLYMDGVTAENGKGSFNCQFAWDFERGKKGYSKNTIDIVRRAYNSTAGYDGVIFKDVVDSGEGQKIKADDLYVAFNSEQIKSVNNTEPSEKYDIRYSRGEGYDLYAEYHYYENRKVYGESIVDALERTVETQEDRAIIDDYRKVEKEVDEMRTELAALNNEIFETIYTPMDQAEASRIEGMRNDVKTLNREIRALEKEVKKARDNVTVTEGVIRDPQSSENVRNSALIRIVQERQALTRLERTLSAKKSALEDIEAQIDEARDPRKKKLEELREKAAKLRREISKADKSLLDLRSTKRFRTLLARERAQAIKDTKALMSRRQTESAKRQKNTVLRQRIWKELQRLDSMLALPSVAKHIPDTMRSTVALLSKAVPGRDVDYDAKIAALEEKLENSTGQEYREAKERMAEYLAKKEYANRVTNALSDVFKKLPKDSPVFDEEVYKEIEALKKEIAGKSLDELENSELKRLHDVICATKAAIKNADRVFGERRGLADLGMEGTEEVLSANDDKARGPIRQKLHDFFEAQSFSMLKPYELFELTGSTVLYERFRKLQAREGVYFRNVNEASEYYKRVAKKHGITDRMLREKFSFTTSEGREIALSINEIMSIYLMKDRAQAMVHLTNPSGGFRFAGGYTVETKKAKKAKTTDEKMKTVKYVYKKTSDPVHLTDVDVISIANMLTKEQKAFANAIQRYMADVLGDKGNEVSMALHDFQKYNDPNYFPIHTDESYRLLSIEKAAGEIQLKNLGFTKDLKHKASGPLVLENMTDVFARHANEMSLYHAFAIELENMKRVLNFSDPVSDEGGTGKGMKAALGQAMTNEIVDFIKSVNGGLRSENMGVADTMIALNKAARVGASLSVAIQQPSAILRSFAMIDPKYFTGIPRKGSWEEMKKYTATAGIKELGGVDVNTSKAITDQLTELDFKGRTAGKNISKVVSKAAFILPEVGDRVAWISLWNACKREAAETYRGEAILIEAGKRFDEIVNRTQVYDSVFSRSKLMRSKNTFAKMVTAFMAEPMTTANMMIQAFRDIKSKNKSKIKAGMRAVAAVATSVIINNALVAFIYAMRDDDEDESYVEKYIEAFIQKMGTDVNPVTYIPVFKDILSLIQGYDVERMDMSLVSDVIDEAQSLYKLWEKEDATEEDWMNAWLSFGGRILDFAGIPISNAVRDGNAIKNLIGNRKTKRTKQGLKEAAMDGLFEESNIIFLDKFAPSDSDADKLYRAIVSGDTARYNQITKRLDKEGKTTKQIQSLIVTGLKNNDERVTAAAEARNTGDLAKYEKLLKEITKDGFASSYVSKAVESIVSKMNEEPPEGDEFGAPDPRKKDKYSSIYNADDIFINLEAGDVKEAQVAIDDIYINKYNKALSDLKDDENEDDAVRKAYNSMRSMISNDYRPLYKAGDNAERERIEELLLDIYINGDQLYGEFNFDKWKEE